MKIIYIDDETDRISDYLDILFKEFHENKILYYDTIFHAENFINNSASDIRLIIADVMFAGNNEETSGTDAGIKLYNRLKTNNKTAHIPIILLTNRSKNSFNENILKSIKNNKDKLLEKNPKKDIFLSTEIKDILNNI